MKFIHSWWSVPALRNRWEVNYLTQIRSNIYLYALSVLYCKNLDLRIELHTDSLGAELLGWLPYDNVVTDLDCIPLDTTIGLWACSKFYCMEHESLDAIHIDGDVFVKSEKVLDKVIDNSHYDCIVQHIEYLSNQLSNIYSDSMQVIKHLNFTEGCSAKMTNAYNTGFVKFNNSEFKKIYFDNYWSMYHQIQGDQKVKDWYNSHAGWSADIILEQQQLYDLSAYNSYKVITLLDYDSKGELTPSANDLGYTHVIGSNKYRPETINKVMNRIKELSLNTYEYLINNDLRVNDRIESYRSSIVSSFN